MSLADALRDALERGHRAQPGADRRRRARRGGDGDGITPAAVLVAVVDRPEPTVILTLRPETMRKHPGQVSFPGGRIDPGDDGPIAAACARRRRRSACRRDRGRGDRHRRPSTAPSPASRSRRWSASSRPICRSARIPARSRRCSRRRSTICSIPATSIVRTADVARARAPLLRDRMGGPADLGRDRGDDRQPQPAAGAGRMNLPDAPWQHRARHGRACSPRSAPRRARPACRRLRPRHPARPRRSATSISPPGSPPEEVMAPARARRGIKAVPTGLAHGTVTAVDRRRAGRGHDLAPRRRHRRPPRHHRLHRRLARGCGAARLHHQRAVRRSGERRDLRLFRRRRRSRGAPGPLHRRSADPHRRGPSAHPALLPLPRPLRRRRARRRRRSTPARRAPTI